MSTSCIMWFDASGVAKAAQIVRRPASLHFWDVYPSMHQNQPLAIVPVRVDRTAGWEYSGSALPILRHVEEHFVGNTLQGKTVVVVGRGSGIARAGSLL